MGKLIHICEYELDGGSCIICGLTVSDKLMSKRVTEIVNRAKEEVFKEEGGVTMELNDMIVRSKELVKENDTLKKEIKILERDKGILIGRLSILQGANKAYLDAIRNLK